MIASTNLVIELGIVLYLLLGWQFVVAQFVGGALMIAALSFTTHYVSRGATKTRCASGCCETRRPR